MADGYADDENNTEHSNSPLKTACNVHKGKQQQRCSRTIELFFNTFSRYDNTLRSLFNSTLPNTTFLGQHNSNSLEREPGKPSGSWIRSTYCPDSP